MPQQRPVYVNGSWHAFYEGGGYYSIWDEASDVRFDKASSMTEVKRICDERAAVDEADAKQWGFDR